MVLLSFGRHNMTAALEGQPRFDQTFVDRLASKPYPVIDMRDSFRQKYQSFDGSADQFLKPYYNGHHTPAGNFFTAWAIKNRVVEWLDPAPRPYQDKAQKQ